jgi:UDP-GlcNAc:undecaprenyl-phosphate/decaprenyl-phosphate GlcNAc-1-phosphate transferase
MTGKVFASESASKFRTSIFSRDCTTGRTLMLEHLPIHSLVLIGSFLTALVVTPFVRTAATIMGVVDHPDRMRKLHGRTVARSGGTAVLFSVLFICGLSSLAFAWVKLPVEYWLPYLGLLTAMVLIWLVGLADDVWGLRGHQKLTGQIVAAAVLIASGFQIQYLVIFGVQINLGVFMMVPITLLWLLFTTNALNLIDGADGFCSTLGAIICGALGVLASVNHHFAEAAIAFAFCGALLGFLVYNFPPASIFLGDSGSLLVGMVAGALAIRCSLKGPAGVAFIAPLAILFLPLLDSTMAIIRRKLTGRSIYTTDRGHLHHSLRRKGLGERGLLMVVTVLAMITAAGALASQLLGREWIATVSVVVVFLLLVVSRAFGYSEVVLVTRRVSGIALGLWDSRREHTAIQAQAIRLQGTREWEVVWQILVEFADQEALSRLQLDLNVPWLEEGFHGRWKRNCPQNRSERWSTSLPLYAAGRLAGRLDISGPASGGHTISSLTRLAVLLEDLTPQIERILDEEVLAERLQAGQVAESQLVDSLN